MKINATFEFDDFFTDDHSLDSWSEEIRDAIKQQVEHQIKTHVRGFVKEKLAECGIELKTLTDAVLMRVITDMVGKESDRG